MTLTWWLANGTSVLAIVYSVLRLMESVYVQAKTGKPVDLTMVAKEFFTFG